MIRYAPMDAREGILRHTEGMDLLPASIELSGMEILLVNAMSREFTMKSCLQNLRKDYDYILIDRMPSLGMLTINALAAADSVIVPVLKVEGVLLTLADMRTNLAKATAKSLYNNYGSSIPIYQSIIPMAIKAAEVSAAGTSLYAYDRGSPAAEAYRTFTREVLRSDEKKRDSLRASRSR